MGLLAKFKLRQSAPEPDAESGTPETVSRARIRARQRLIGATVLLMVGLVAFPMLFESQPRPVAIDLPIVIPVREAPPLAGSRLATLEAASAPLLPQVVIEPGEAASLGAGAVSDSTPPAALPAPRGSVVPAASAAKFGGSATTAPATPVVQKAAPVAQDRVGHVRPEVGSPKGTAPPQASDSRSSEKPPETTASESRFVVQIGAYAEAAGAHDVRLKVESLGLKTYTQVIEPASGRRIRVRVGPFANRAEAEKVAAKLRASGLAPAVLSL